MRQACEGLMKCQHICLDNCIPNAAQNPRRWYVKGHTLFEQGLDIAIYELVSLHKRRAMNLGERGSGGFKPITQEALDSQYWSKNSTDNSPSGSSSIPNLVLC